MPFTAVPATAPASTLLTAAADRPPPAAPSARPTLWAVTIAAVLALVAARLPGHPQAARGLHAGGRWLVGVLHRAAAGVRRLGLERASAARSGVEYYTGYLVEKSLSVDNLFVFMLLLAPSRCRGSSQQRVLLIGVVGALALRGVFIALGAQMLARFDWTFLLFGARPPRHRRQGAARRRSRRRARGRHRHSMRTVRLIRRFMPVTDDYHGTRMTVRDERPPRAHPAGAGDGRGAGHRRRLRRRLGAGGLRHHRRPVPRLRHQRLRAARPPRALLRARGRAVAAGAPRLRPGGDPGASSASSWCCTGRTASGRPPRRCRRWPRSASSSAILALVTATSLRAGKRAGLAGAADVDDPEPEPAPTQR